jgi:hypothetical protein
MAILVRATTLTARTSKASSRQAPSTSQPHRLASANQAEEITMTHRVLQTNLDPGHTTFRISASLRKEAPRGILEQRSLLEVRGRSYVATKAMMKCSFQTSNPWREAVQVPLSNTMLPALHSLPHFMLDRLPCHLHTPRTPRLMLLIKTQSLIVPLRISLMRATSKILRARRTAGRRKREVTDYHTALQTQILLLPTSNGVARIMLSEFITQ